MRDKVKQKKIIITGASSGIGEKIAWHIAKSGGIPIMVARSIDKLKQLQTAMKNELDTTSFVYQIDLLDPNQLTATFHSIIDEHVEVHGLINNAGVGIFESANDLSWQDIERMFQLNVYALIKGTKTVLPHFLRNKKGSCHIINIASQAGKMATPKSSVYAATKHAVLGFTNAIRLELSEENIFVTAVNLGPVRTAFFKTADPHGTYQQNVARYMLDPDKVAKKVVSVLFTSRREINMPRWMEVGSKLYNLFPGMMEMVLKRQFNKK
ncbi:SDR family NAD(P)-dependent oxidoreductase [Ornithinibacillus sp. L9]|uniref:SDR family NAD(P)-dependent oxidoreductase n=1 Tax=Ornithinibacillus caprae TaxID=2678566 RepID=A0A6N8FCC6_9BACI|nr:SDR family oxidoreductase [Ornithinibacillus caprae]MUK87203.1 SDR family NAD(P)-dependent oxidoreductase [Ornithinibacillus caprae]